jgi:hypothetical protein
MDTSQINDVVQYALTRAAHYQVPSPADFDEAAYLTAWPDVAEAIRRGEIKSAFVHYVLFGAAEGRPRPTRLVER